MRRFQGNPILKPIANHRWESRAVFNAAAVYAEEKIHILYRAIGDDGISRIGYASSYDGYNIDERISYPIFEPKDSKEQEGCEDPRLTLIGNKYIMTYTALYDLKTLRYQIALSTINASDLVNNRWSWSERLTPFPGIRNKDAAVFPKKIDDCYVLFHRFEPDICVAYSQDLSCWFDIKSIVSPRPTKWDSVKIGIAGPPIELNVGWLLIYHGVDFSSRYRLGVLLLDKNDIETVLYRSENSILEPVENYERFGMVPNVVFSCGSIKLDNKILIYYGGADTTISVATYDINELIP
jgi:predicted GH43/DUF377 family glycosyl hydrolase